MTRPHGVDHNAYDRLDALEAEAMTLRELVEAYLMGRMTTRGEDGRIRPLTEEETVALTGFSRVEFKSHG